jgi:rod shape-determining protein MreC
MENIFTGRRRNMTILVGVLTIQFFGLAAQFKRPTEQNSPSTPVLRIWVVNTITPFEKVFFHATGSVRNTFASYFYLRGVRKENEDLRRQIQNMRLEQVRLEQDAAQAHRLQTLLAFKEQFVSDTIAAQVIGTSGTDISRTILIDKGLSDGLKDNMAVVTPDGVVGKVAKAFHSSSQVLLISDPSWGAGAILTQSRLQGIVKGTQAGTVQLQYIMADNTLQPGEQIVTSGGDGIFPKGLQIGTVREVNGSNKEGFLNVRINPAADLNRLEEVLVITKIVEKENPDLDLSGPVRASDILAQRLPSVPQKPAEDAAKKPNSISPAGTAPNSTKPVAPNPTAASGPNTPDKKPSTTSPAASSKPASIAPSTQSPKPVSGPASTAPANPTDTKKPVVPKSTPEAPQAH